MNAVIGCHIQLCVKVSNLSRYKTNFTMSVLRTISTILILIVSPTFSQVVPEDTSTSSNNCCQGPGGIPGIPGIPGSAGPLGAPGPKGEVGGLGLSVKGEKGDIGEMGPIGMEGPPGEPGMRGPAGKVGPLGIQGPSGQDGLDGPSGSLGQKGEKGDQWEARLFSGFSVLKTNPEAGVANRPVTFETVITDAAGHYDTGSNKFICQIPGYYFFTFSIGAINTHHPYVSLVKNGVGIVDAYIHPSETTSGYRAMATNSVLLNLVAGDEVWIVNGHIGREIFAAVSNYKWSTFSGVLLHQT